MRKSLFNYFICFGIVFLVTACSFISISVNKNTSQSIGEDDMEDTTLAMDTVLLECTLISINKANNYEILRFPLGSITPTLTIKNNGKFSGFAVCNSFFGKYTSEGKLISFGGTTSSHKNCVSNAHIENIIRGTLGTVDNYSIKDGQLLLKKGKDVLMVYRINRSK